MEQIKLGYPDRFDTIDTVIQNINETNEPLVNLSSDINMHPTNNLTEQNYTYDCDALKGHIEQSPLSDAFFSLDNIKYINNSIRYIIYSKTNQVIDSVESNELLSIMRTTFFENIKHSNDLKKEFNDINNIVIKSGAEKALDNLKEYIRYMEDISSTGIKIFDRPEWMGKTQKTFDLSSIHS